MDGVSFLKKLRTDPGYGAHAFVIILSNIEDEQIIKETVKLGVSDFLIKSNWGVTELAERIKMLIT